jgi:hypothetical protein
VVLLVLALIWAAALLPPFVRSRMEGSPADSVGRFKRHLRVLQSTSPAASSLANASETTSGSTAMPAVWANEARRLKGMRRRRQIALGLVVAMAVTFVVGLLPSLHRVLVLNVAFDAMFAGYVALLARLRSIETERQMDAHFARLRQMQISEEASVTREHPIVADVL